MKLGIIERAFSLFSIVFYTLMIDGAIYLICGVFFLGLFLPSRLSVYKIQYLLMIVSLPILIVLTNPRVGILSEYVFG